MGLDLAHAQSTSLLGIEVTQGIQSISEANPRDPAQDNLVPLIKKRKMLIRAYFSDPGEYNAILWVAPAPNKPGVFLISNNSGTFVKGPPLNRADLSTSLNFDVPAWLMEGDSITIRSPAVLDSSATSTHPQWSCLNCASFQPVTLPVLDGYPLRIRLIGFSYQTANAGITQTHAPTELQFQKTLSWLQRAYPVTGIRFPLDGPTRDVVPYDTSYGDLSRRDEDENISIGCTSTNEQLRIIKASDLLHNSSNPIVYGSILRSRYIGLLSDTGFENTFVTGCANGSPDVNFDLVATAPIGQITPNRFPWDDDGFYGDWQTAHELGHTFGELHPVKPIDCGVQRYPDNRDTRVSPDPPSEPRYVGLDFGAIVDPVGQRVFTGSNPRAIPGNWHDFMSYCPDSKNNTGAVSKWINPVSYNTIRAAIAVENPKVLDMGIRYAVDSGLTLERTQPDSINTDAPPPSGFSLAEYLEQKGLAIACLPAPENHHVPLLCEKITGPHHLPFNSFIGVSPSALVPAPPTPVHESSPSSITPSEPTHPASEALSQKTLGSLQPFLVETGRFVSVIAKVDLSLGEGSLIFVRETTLARTTPTTTDPRVEIRITNRIPNGDEVITTKPMALEKYSDAQSQRKGIGMATAMVRIEGQTTRVELFLNGKLAYEILVPSAKPTVEGLQYDKQTVGDPFIPKSVRLTWKAPSSGLPSSSHLTYTVLISYDNKDSWQTIAVGLTTQSFDLSPERLNGFKQVLVKIVASDGYHVGEQVISIASDGSANLHESSSPP